MLPAKYSAAGRGARLTPEFDTILTRRAAAPGEQPLGEYTVAHTPG